MRVGRRERIGEDGGANRQKRTMKIRRGGKAEGRGEEHGQGRKKKRRRSRRNKKKMRWIED